MPEKRRRNNKNKRKNKNNRPEVSNVNKDTKQISDNETNSNQSESKCDKNSIEQISSEKNAYVEVISQHQTSPSKTENVTDSPSNNAQVLNVTETNESENKTQSSIEDSLILRSEDVLEIDSSISTSYVVESPDQAFKNKPKISNAIKSKSLDSDDIPKIVEITEDAASQCEEADNLSMVNTSNVLIADVESDVEWEKTDDLHNSEQTKNAATGTLSITTMPLDVAQCQETKSLTPQEEISLRNYLKTLDLSISPENVNSVEIKTEIEQIINREIKHRLRKKGITEEFLTPRVGHPRMLDVIDEEGSSESSSNSRRQSYLSDKKSDCESMDDDVFEDKNSIKHKFSSKASSSLRDVTFGRLVPQKCILVGAKLKEPEVCEARGDWTMTTVEKMTGAEVVYLTDSSSSTSSLHEIGDDNDDGIESDVSIRMTTPTIEVTDTENLLKNTFITKNDTLKLASDNMKQPENKSIEHIIKIETEKDNNILPNDKESAQTSHEIVVLSTDNIKTNLYVKDIDDNYKTKENNYNNETVQNVDLVETKEKELNASKSKNAFDLEIKVIKCELNDAINNLIKEVTSDSETANYTTKDDFTRQDSSSSICSSQCTAKYNPTYSSLNDVSNLQSDEISENTAHDVEQSHVSQEHKKNIEMSHVKDVVKRVTEKSTDESKNNVDTEQPFTLKDICLKRVASFPFGDKILEELASVSEKLQNISAQASISNRKDKFKDNVAFNSYSDSKTSEKSVPIRRKSLPPPITPRHSSLKISQDDNYLNGSNKIENRYVCLSPSQKMLMEKTKTYLSDSDSVELNNKQVYKTVNFNNQVEFSKNISKADENFNNLPTAPFKSQTGSRLLALICDPSITANVNSLKKYCNDNIQHSETKVTSSELKPLFNKDKPSTIRDFSNIFKPIPPPRSRKMSSSIYESDESSDFTDHSFRSMKKEKKTFHFSTGNLNKEIENDISSIQNRHRFYTDFQEESHDYNVPRRPSLPKDLCDQQMEYIRQKEKEVEAEIKRLQEKQNSFSNLQRRGPRAPLISEKEIVNERVNDVNNYSISHKRNVIFKSSVPDIRSKENSKMSSLFSSSQEELQREKMYSEYITRMAEREERKQHKIIKITNTPAQSKNISKSMSSLDVLDSKTNNRIEKEFISKARERWEKLGIRDPETESESELGKNVYKEPKVIEHKIKVIEGGQEKDVKKLPNHLQDFVRFTAKDKEASSSAVWRPNAPTPPPAPAPSATPSGRSPGGPPPPPPPPVWAPGSAGASPQTPRKTYRPVHFEETPPSRRKFGDPEQNGCTSGSESEGRLRTSQSAPATGLSNLSSSTSRLPRAQNPTVTLLQKAREGQIPRGSSYLQIEKDSARLPRDRPSPPKGDPVYALRKEYASETEAECERDRAAARKMADAHNKIEGIGPITKDGMPVALRSEVKDPSRWYKKMYDTIHKNKYDGEPGERVLLNKSQYMYLEPRSGYMSEPEGAGLFSGGVGAGAGRRRTASVQDDMRASPAPHYAPHNKYSTLASGRASQEVYKTQPGRIEDYVPGRSSVVDKEAKQQNISSTTSLPQASPKEKKDITSTILSKSNMAKALKESGYESDSTLVFRRRDDTDAPLSPAERRAAYRDLQAGGEPPIRGFRSPAPPRQESPRRYVESDVNIHYRCPVRHDPLPLVPERELARQQAEHMKRLYREQRRNKYLQELQDMQNRRHQDNFTPSQKTVVPLNRYDEADKVIAKALYTFNGQTARELSFRKGDIIHVRRQIDSNWYEGEVHGKIGLFPYNYVELQKGDTVQTLKKPAVVEGRARAKFDFTAQTNLELPLKKGEVVVLTRRIDQNWWEGRNGVKTGIFPDSYVTILQEPSPSKPELKPILSTEKPMASPAAHGLLNGSDKRSMGAHSYTPQQNSAALANAPPASQPLPGYAAKPAQAMTPSERGYGPPTGAGVDLNNTEPLYVDTNAEAVPYRAMYKYRPQNPDELELCEGDTVYVLEQCDDGWYVGSSQRTGRFGTFPGNYVERI